MKKKKPRSVIMGRQFAVYLGVAVVAMTTTIWGTFDPSVMYYNTSNGNFGLGTEAPQTYLHLKNQNPVITLMTTSAGQTVDNNGTNNGWMGLLFMSPTTNGGTARTKWDMTYSARDQQLYFYDYGAARKTLMLPDGGMPVINGGLVVSGSVGIGTQTPDAALHVAQYVLNGEYLAQHLQNLGGGTAIVTVKIGEGTPESQYGILGHYGVDNSFRIGAVGPSGNHSLQFHTGNTSGTQLTSERMRITAVGNMGIGTMAPSEKLEVAGNVKANQFIGDGSRLAGILSSNSSALQVSGDGTVTLGRVTGSGGTNTANAAVKVYQSSNTDWTAKFVNGGGSGYGILIQTGAGAETPLISAMDNYGNSRMYLSTTGKLGIGTTQPTEKLDVVGNIQLSTFPARLGVAVADTFTYDGDALANYGLSVYNDSTGFPTAGTMVALSGYRGIRFFAGGSHAMSVSGAGNVGIGTTTAGT
ncbi:hypothetical protein EBZ35_05770, partial [bacterium]|nr:hypothetical protein [bacterium]